MILEFIMSFIWFVARIFVWGIVFCLSNYQ